MATAFIWKFRGKDIAWGHASVLVDRTYMSWWPEGSNRRSSKLHRNIYTAGPFRARTYEDDVAGEDNKDPDYQIVLNGLDEDAMKTWWQSFGLTRDGVLYYGPLQPWETLTLNCSTVASRALYMGGGDKYASWAKSVNVIWTPNDVYEYALSIQTGLRRAQK